MERLVEPPEVKHERLLVVSILGLLVNLVGIFVFQVDSFWSRLKGHIVCGILENPLLISK